LDQHPNYIRSDLEYKDLGKSGYHGEHIADGGGWAKLLVAVKAGLIQPGDVVLVEAIDRTGRLDTSDMLHKVIIPILQAGVSIITLDDDTTYSKQTVNTPLIHLLLAKIQAAYGYSKQLSERITASYESRRAKARNGERIKRFAVTWLTTDGQVKPQYRSAVKQVFDLYISGVGKNTIATRIRASGVPELAKISGPTIDNWLKNRAAIGYWNDIPNVCEPVVSPEIFMQAQRRQKEMETGPRTRTSKHFLIGLVKCGVCGASYIIHRKDGMPNSMRCLTHQQTKSAGCKNAETIPYQVVHNFYLETAPLWIDRALKVIQLTNSDKQKLILATEREEVTASIQRLAKLLARMDSEELEMELHSATERRTLIDSELKILERTDVNDGENKSTSIFVGYEGTLSFDRLTFHDPVQLSALLKQAGYSITIQPGRKLYLPDDNEPWIYTGVARKGNTTLGYRIQDGEMEYTISNVIPEPFDVREYNNTGGDLTHIMGRSYKHVKSPTPLNPTGKRNVKGMAAENFESADAAMQHLTSGVKPDTNK
jgi:DNA invertase Pin-like site-specific DNA recombinase